MSAASVRTLAGRARATMTQSGDGPGAQLRDAGIQVVAFVLSMGLLVALLAALGYQPDTVVDSLWTGSVGDPQTLSLSLREAVPIILCAAAVWLAFQAGLFNVGADGQLQVGGLCALVICLKLDALPGVLLALLAIAAAMVGGALWAGIAAWMKTVFSASEVITTIMLNFIAFEVVAQTGSKALQSSTIVSQQTDEVPDNVRFGEIAGGAIGWTFVIAVVVALAVVAFVNRTTIGLRLRAMGLNAESVRHAGIRVQRYWLGVFCISGALAGLAGALVILGMRFFIAPGWAPAWGYLGILVAFLVLRSPYLLPLWGLLFGMLGAAGPALKADLGVSPGIVTLMQALPVVMLFALYTVGRYLSRLAASRRGGRPQDLAAATEAAA